MDRSDAFKVLFSLPLALLAAAPALAGGTGNGSAGSGQALHGNGADIPQFTYQADAERLCKGDTVVWGSSAHPGVFFTLAADGRMAAGSTPAWQSRGRRATRSYPATETVARAYGSSSTSQ
jgi:hypothetical protein